MKKIKSIFFGGNNRAYSLILGDSKWSNLEQTFLYFTY